MSLQEVIDGCTTNAPKGFALLNEKNPGWMEGFNLDGLDMRFPSRCVLGRVYGNYYDGLETLFGEPNRYRNGDAEEYGFFVNVLDGDSAWNDLGEDWAALITAAREEEAAKVVA